MLTGDAASAQSLVMGAPCNIKAKMAVKNGVVAPIAWLKEIGMYLSDTLPSTTVRQKMDARTATLMNCAEDFSRFVGVKPIADRKIHRMAHATI